MTDLAIRRATHSDIGDLIEMRRDFTFEDSDAHETIARSDYELECGAFLVDAIEGGRWHIWVAEVNGSIVSHVYVALIDKIPRPVREKSKIAYLTNVYTRPAFRGQGIGAKLIERAQDAAREENVELMIVWPSDESIEFYKRHGFGVPIEPLIWDA